MVSYVIGGDQLYLERMGIDFSKEMLLQEVEESQMYALKGRASLRAKTGFNKDQRPERAQHV